MKNLKKFITTLLVALMAFAAVPGNAFALDSYTSINGAFAGTKELTFQNAQQLNDYINNAQFEWTATFVPELSNTATGYEVPTVVPTNPVGDVTFTKGDFTEGALTATKTVNWHTNALTFTNPGVYAFYLVENPTENNYVTDVTTWTVFFNVENAKDGENDILKVESVKYYKGELAKNTSLDGIQGLTAKADQANFTNKYSDNSGKLNVKKTVTGKFGDKTKDFTFKVTFHDVTEANFDTLVETEATYDNVNSTETEKIYTFNLKDGEVITFEKLPVGTKYTVEETDAATGYTTSYTVTVDGTSSTPVSGKETSGNDVIKTNATLVEFTNTANNSPVTGFVMSMLPYVGILVIAGVAVALVMKRRSTSNF